MSLGELPISSNYRVYYKLEDLTDSGINGYNLTNNNSVSFISNGKFNGCADFGSSGTNKALSYGANPMSGLTFPNATFSMWVKFNDVTTSNANAGIFHIATRLSSGAGASRVNIFYSIVDGTVQLTANNFLTTTSAQIIYSIPSASISKWYNIIIVKSDITTLKLYIDGVLVGSDTGVGSEHVNATLISYIAIGNRNAVSYILQAFANIDEIIIEEREWSNSEIRKYYTQGVGRYHTQ